MLAFGGGLNATLDGGNISDTQAGSTVLVLAASTLTVQSTICAENKARKGTLCGYYSSRLVVHQATFANNAAEVAGGGRYLLGSNCTVLDSRFDQNMAEELVGAAYVKFSSLHVNSTVFISNTAPIGGAVTVYGNSYVAARAEFTYCSLLNNTARPLASSGDPLKTGVTYTLGVGGALYVERSSISITSSRVWGNIALVDGGECRDTQGVTRELRAKAPRVVRRLCGGGIMYVVAHRASHSVRGLWLAADCCSTDADVSQSS